MVKVRVDCQQAQLIKVWGCIEGEEEGGGLGAEPLQYW